MSSQKFRQPAKCSFGWVMADEHFIVVLRDLLNKVTFSQSDEVSTVHLPHTGAVDFDSWGLFSV